jgi:hypothetical protein
MEWIYTEIKLSSGQDSLELALENRKKEKMQFFTQLVQAYLIFPWVCGGLIDRYSGVDYAYES